MKPRILVTTGAGRTGAVAALELARKGFPVRCLVHRDDQRATGLRKAGIEVAVGSLYDWRDLQAALHDVQRAYHCPPFDSRQLHGSTMFAMAAEDAGLEVVALMSAWNPHPTHPSIVQREHWLTNNLYRRLPFDVIHVNPGMFAFTYFLGLPAIVHMGLLALPFGDGLNAPPSNEDIGEVAARVLENPAPYVGRCLRPTGPRLLSPQDVAASMGELLGHRIRYRDVSIRMFRQSRCGAGIPDISDRAGPTLRRRTAGRRLCRRHEPRRGGVRAPAGGLHRDRTPLPQRSRARHARTPTGKPRGSDRLRRAHDDGARSRPRSLGTCPRLSTHRKWCTGPRQPGLGHSRPRAQAPTAAAYRPAR